MNIGQQYKRSRILFTNTQILFKQRHSMSLGLGG